MDIQAEKYSLIEYITKISDVKVLEKLKQFVSANDRDFWNELTDSEKHKIRQGIEELDRGEKFDYEEMMLKHR